MSFPRSSYHWSPASPRLIFLESINQLKCCKPITYLNEAAKAGKGACKRETGSQIIQVKISLGQSFFASSEIKADNILQPCPCTQPCQHSRPWFCISSYVLIMRNSLCSCGLNDQPNRWTRTSFSGEESHLENIEIRRETKAAWDEKKRSDKVNLNN